MEWDWRYSLACVILAGTAVYTVARYYQKSDGKTAAKVGGAVVVGGVIIAAVALVLGVERIEHASDVGIGSIRARVDALITSDPVTTSPAATDERVRVSLRCGEVKVQAIRPHTQTLVLVPTNAPAGGSLSAAFAHNDQRIRFTYAIGWLGPLDSELNIGPDGADRHVLKFSYYVRDRLRLLFAEDKPEVPFRIWFECP
jgi:hypothetical protein